MNLKSTDSSAYKNEIVPEIAKFHAHKNISDLTIRTKAHGPEPLQTLSSTKCN